jgi:hypothetical protein
LAQPAVRVTLKADAASATINIGDTVLGGEKGTTFVTLGERPDRVIAVRRADLAGIFKETARSEAGSAAGLTRNLADFRSRRLLGSEAGEATALFKTIKIQANGQELELTKGADNEWSFVKPAGFGKADLAGATEPSTSVYTGVRPLLNALTNLQAASAADFNEQPGDLAQYGLQPENPNIVRIELIPSSGPSEVLLLGKVVEENGKPTLPMKVYAKVPGDRAVVTIATDRRDAIVKTVADPSELRNRDLFGDSQRERIDALDLTVQGKTVKLRRVPVGQAASEKRWVLYGGPNDPQEANQAAAQDLVTALARPRVALEPVTPPYDAAFNPADRRAELKVWVGGVPADLKPADGGKPAAEVNLTGTPIEILFGTQAGGAVFTRRLEAGQGNDFKLAEAVLKVVARPRVDFVVPKFTGLPVADVATLTLTPASGVVTEVHRPDAKGSWTFRLPANRKDQPADAEIVDALVGVLNTLTPERVTHESPDAQALQQAGLTPPVFQAALTPTGADAKAVSFAFGKPTPDGGSVYARGPGSDNIVTVLKVAVDRLMREDLRDRTIYKLDPASVTGLKIRGWKDTSGVKVVEFEKQGENWIAKTPGNSTADSAKVNALLTQLYTPKMMNYIGLGKLEYGLSVDQLPEALEFTMLRGALPAVTLVLGGKAGDGLVYAASSAVPGEAMTYRPDMLRTLTEKPTSLMK